jgi:hypothetical protein
MKLCTVTGRFDVYIETVHELLVSDLVECLPFREDGDNPHDWVTGTHASQS